MKSIIFTVFILFTSISITWAEKYYEGYLEIDYNKINSSQSPCNIIDIKNKFGLNLEAISLIETLEKDKVKAYDVQVLVLIKNSDFSKQNIMYSLIIDEFKDGTVGRRGITDFEMKYFNLNTDYAHALYKDENLLKELRKKATHALFFQLPFVMDKSSIYEELAPYKLMKSKIKLMIS